jgi:glucokinase
MAYIGIDLGGTNIAAAIVTEDGVIVRRKSAPTLNRRHYREILSDMADICEELAEPGDDISGIGIGIPGSIDPRRGFVNYANNLNFKNTPVAVEMRELTGLPVYIENDANCAALGEYISGAAKGARHSITVTLGTGVGGGIIIGGAIYNGAYSAAGEVGHHCIVVDGEQCTCGRRGCFESYASATALIRDARRSVERFGGGLMLDIAGGIENITAKTVFDAAQAGDNRAMELIGNYIKYVAEGLTNLINIFQPDTVAVGGGISRQGENLLGPVREHVRSIVYGGELKTRIAAAKLGNDAGIIGAAAACRAAIAEAPPL